MTINKETVSVRLFTLTSTSLMKNMVSSVCDELGIRCDIIWDKELDVCLYVMLGNNVVAQYNGIQSRAELISKLTKFRDMV